MAVLVDAARWHWRGTTWCHLVSDESFEELHAFAARLGCRRVGFQGDHYDIDADTRLRAIELGAVPTDSRELVRRIRSAGLRARRSTFEKWSLVDREGLIPTNTLERIAASSSPCRHAGELALDVLNNRIEIARMEGWFLLQRSAAGAVVFFGVESSESLEELHGPDLSLIHI